MHNGNYETYLETKEKLGNYFDIQIIVIAFFNESLHVKEMAYLPNHTIIQSGKIHVNISVSVKGQVFFFFFRF